MESRRKNVDLGFNAAMESRRKNVAAVDRRRSTTNGRDYFDSFPEDIILNILVRLPAKSIAKLRCVSKKFNSVLRSRDFTEMFFTRSCAQPPKILFVCRERGQLFFFSAPQPQDLDENEPPLTVNYHMKFECPGSFSEIYAPVAGLVCFIDYRCLGESTYRELVTSVCNPSNGQCFLLPKIKKMNTRKRIRLKSFLGYDPVDKLFKVLGLLAIISSNDVISMEHKVLTLGSKESPWRTIQCGTWHCPGSKLISIDGVLYYSAKVERGGTASVIVCFDVRTETFSFIPLAKEFLSYEASFSNYNGKFASFRWTTSERISIDIGRKTTSFELSVLQDLEKQEWLKRVYKLPPLWHDVIGDNDFLKFVGVIGTDQVVLSSRSPYGPFYVCYYNTKTETIRRAEIQGMEESEDSQIFMFINHVENVRFMETIQN